MSTFFKVVLVTMQVVRKLKLRRGEERLWWLKMERRR